MTAPTARFHGKSSNRKLAPVERVPYDHPRYKFRPTPRAPFCSSTYASITATCSDDCPFKRDASGKPGGCFIDSDQFMHRAMQKLDAGAQGRTGIDVIHEEAKKLDRAFHGKRVPQDGARGGRDLRLHVGGDVPSAAGARVLAGAAARWRLRGGGAVWTYTHSWRDVPREAFGSISVLASVENEHQVLAARARGYAPALVVDRFPDGKRPFLVASIRVVPCPAETLAKTCVECRLCLDVDLTAKGLGIGFQVHGLDSAAAVRALTPLTTRAKQHGGSMTIGLEEEQDIALEADTIARAEAVLATPTPARTPEQLEGRDRRILKSLDYHEGLVTDRDLQSRFPGLTGRALDALRKSWKAARKAVLVPPAEVETQPAPTASTVSCLVVSEDIGARACVDRQLDERCFCPKAPSAISAVKPSALVGSRLADQLAQLAARCLEMRLKPSDQRYAGPALAMRSGVAAGPKPLIAGELPSPPEPKRHLPKLITAPPERARRGDEPRSREFAVIARARPLSSAVPEPRPTAPIAPAPPVVTPSSIPQQEEKLMPKKPSRLVELTDTEVKSALAKHGSITATAHALHVGPPQLKVRLASLGFDLALLVTKFNGTPASEKKGSETSLASPDRKASSLPAPSARAAQPQGDDEFERMRRILADIRALGSRERHYVLSRLNEELAAQVGG